MKRLLFLLFFPLVVEAQGISYLGLCNKTWECRKTFQSFTNRKEILVGWLEGSFGSECACGDKILASPRPKVIRIHLTNGPCLRNRRCGRHEVFYGYTIPSASRALEKAPERLNRRFLRVIERTKARLAKGRNYSCLISPVLESDFKESVRLKWLKLAESHFPSCDMVDNPLKRPCLPGYVCERHGVNIKAKAPCIADLDGIDGSKVDLKKWSKAVNQCDLKFYWEPWMNCIRDSFIDPINRNCEYKTSRFKKAKEQACKL